jgi:succinate dehydrogenase/fumarate reductase cytochrome b subunit
MASIKILTKSIKYLPLSTNAVFCEECVHRMTETAECVHRVTGTAECIHRMTGTAECVHRMTGTAVTACLSAT